MKLKAGRAEVSLLPAAGDDDDADANDDDAAADRRWTGRKTCTREISRY